MPKYYVLSGFIHEVIDAESPKGACVKVVNKKFGDHEYDDIGNRVNPE